MKVKSRRVMTVDVVAYFKAPSKFSPRQSEESRWRTKFEPGTFGLASNAPRRHK